MIFVDSNVPMYLVGAAHPNKVRTRVLLEQLVREEKRLLTSAEVFQEILHRYVAIARREAIAPAFEALLGLVDEIFPIDGSDVEAARLLLEEHQALSARDALHAAIMRRYEVTRIVSFDDGFDDLPWVERLH